MVIGTGMIATEFKSYLKNEEYIIFASGVSDSIHTNQAAFEREKKLLKETILRYPGKKMVYFSTCSIYDASMKHSAYVKHKQEMEELVKLDRAGYVIFRLSNPVGRTANKNTVINFFIQCILEGKSFEVWKNASRNILDMDDVYLLCHEILKEHLFSDSVINIANPENYSVPYIILELEKHFGRKGNYHLADKGNGPIIDTGMIKALFSKFDLNFSDQYLSSILKKYFPVNDL